MDDNSSEPLLDYAKYGSPDRRSPVEKAFLHAAKGRLPGLRCQYRVDPYIIDFAIPGRMIAIEIDGHDYHSTLPQRENDNRRARNLSKLGWVVVRFTGSEVFKDPAHCVEEVRKIAASFGKLNQIMKGDSDE